MTAKKSGTSPDKRRKYDEAFKADDLRLASESRSTQAAATTPRRALGTISIRYGTQLAGFARDR